MTVLFVIAGSIVGALASLGLLVVGRVVVMAFGRAAPDAFDVQQRRLNASQDVIARAQRELARRKAQQ